MYTGVGPREGRGEYEWVIHCWNESRPLVSGAIGFSEEIQDSVLGFSLLFKFGLVGHGWLRHGCPVLQETDANRFCLFRRHRNRYRQEEKLSGHLGDKDLQCSFSSVIKCSTPSTAVFHPGVSSGHQTRAAMLPTRMDPCLGDSGRNTAHLHSRQYTESS